MRNFPVDRIRPFLMVNDGKKVAANRVITNIYSLLHLLQNCTLWRSRGATHSPIMYLPPIFRENLSLLVMPLKSWQWKPPFARHCS